jgi:hypothetical protein
VNSIDSQGRTEHDNTAMHADKASLCNGTEQRKCAAPNSRKRVLEGQLAHSTEKLQTNHGVKKIKSLNFLRGY